MSPRFKIYIIPPLGFVVALGMHLWHLNQPSQLVSDEVFFVNEGHDYVTHQPYFDPHPPLGKIELGAVFSVFGFSPFTWRILNAVEGALIIPLLWWIVWRLSRSRVAANIVVLLALMDGILLVESRSGMINVPYVLYSLVALAAILKALESRQPQHWLTVAGLWIGLAVSVKWLALMIVVPTIALWFWPRLLLMARVTEISKKVLGWSLLLLILLPIFMYCAVFQIHFHWLGISSTFWNLNAHMLNYHLSVPATGDPYAQPWWGWLLMWRPFVYFAQTTGNTISSIWSLPNPWLWWTGGIIFIYGLVGLWGKDSQSNRPATWALTLFASACWIPFIGIHRIMYSYHALPFDIFLLMLTAVFLGQWWVTKKRFVIAYLIVAGLTFIFFSPLYFNIPVTQNQLHAREWLPGWQVIEH